MKLLLFLGLSAEIVLAQGSRAVIGGTVLDQSGAGVPDAELTLRSLSTSAVVKVTSAAEGAYSFTNLLPGAYDLSVTAKGFRDYVQKGIALNLDQQVRVDIQLEIGTTVEAVEVSANASPLNFESAVQRGTIQPGTIEELPLILGGQTRSAVAFVRLLPGVTTGGGEDRLNFNTRINGGVNETDEAILDGISIVDGSLGQNGIQLAVTGHPMSPEAIQEITLLTSNYDAQYGYTSSSVLTAVTKSGTNEFHGVLYWLERNAILNARQFGIAERPKDNEHDFGGTLGGPIKLPWFSSGRKKSYFFVNYEAFRLRGATLAPIISVPTDQQRRGDFSDWRDSSGSLIPIYDPATTRPNAAFNTNAPIGPDNLPFLRNQFMGCDGRSPNVICPSDRRLQASLAPAWLQYLPQPNLPGILFNYTPPTPVTSTVNADSTVLDIRGDMYWRESDHFALTVHYYGSYGNSQSIFPREIAQEGYREPNYNFVNRFNWDHTFRPNLVNNFNAGFNTIVSVIRCVDADYADVLPKIPGVVSTALPPALRFQDYRGFGCNDAGETTRPAYIVNDQIMWVKGRHTLTFGGEYRALQDKEISHGNASGTFNFNRLTTGLRGINSGNSFASFLLGDVASASMAVRTLADQHIRQKYGTAHINDNWRVTSKLTLNLGLRWDLSTPTYEKYDRWSFIDPYGPNPGAGNRPGRLVFASDVAGANNPASFGKRYPESIWMRAFAPRVGFAYALNQNTVVRGGYGVFFQPLTYPGWNSGVSGGRDGFNSNVVFNSTDGGITPAILLQEGFAGKQYDQPPFFDETFDNGKIPGVYREFNKGHLPYSQQWNLTVERQFTKDFYVTAAYVANKGTHLISGTLPINVLNPQLLSSGQALYDEFEPGQTELNGVRIPYSGWVEQMQQCTPSVAQALLPYPQFCGNLYPVNENAGYSSFHSFQFKAEKRFSAGSWMLLSYTLSKLLSSGTDQQVFAQGDSAQVISPFERRRNKSLDVQDVPQTLSFTFTYELPMGRGHKFLGTSSGFLDKLVSGWQINSIFRIQSGLPFWFRSSQCNIPSQFAMGCLPALLPGADPFSQSKDDYDPGKGPLLNRAAFENGNTGGVFSFNSGTGPRVSNVRNFGFRNHDLGIQKTTAITEKIRLELRAEFFNAWNWHFFSKGTTWGEAQPFVTDLGRPDFGGWTGQVTAPRNIQLAAKLRF
jgi:hypothetical protein